MCLFPRQSAFCSQVCQKGQAEMKPPNLCSRCCALYYACALWCACQTKGQGPEKQSNRPNRHILKKTLARAKNNKKWANTIPKLSNIDFTFVNNIYVGGQLTVQAVIYTVGSQVSEKQINLNETLIKNLNFPGWEYVNILPLSAPDCEPIINISAIIAARMAVTPYVTRMRC